jgi:hypothetical protein
MVAFIHAGHREVLWLMISCRDMRGKLSEQS